VGGLRGERGLAGALLCECSMVGLMRGHFSVAYFTPIMLVNIVNIPTPHGWRSIELRARSVVRHVQHRGQ